MNLCTESQPSKSAPSNGSSDFQNKPCEAFCHSNETASSRQVTNDDEAHVNVKQSNGQSKDKMAPANKKTSKSTSAKPRRPSKQLYTPPAAKAASPSPEPDQQQVHCSHPIAITDSKNTSSSPAKSVSDSSEVQNNIPNEKNMPSDLDEDASWDTLYDDSGDLIKCDLAKSLQASLKLDDETTHKLTFERPVSDFTDYTSSSVNHAVNCDQIDHEMYPHVLEVYQFSAELKTRDLFSRISTSGSSDFDILWVDETHALAIFGSVAAANAALGAVIPDLSLRVMSQASPASQAKAKKSPDRLSHYKKRPQTSLDTARRLVVRHLGVNVQVSREQMLAEKKLLQEAKDRRRQERKQATDVWEGNVS